MVKGERSSRRKHQENKAGDLEPELVCDSGEVSNRCLYPAHDRTIRAAAADLLSGNAGRNTEFSRRGDVRHSSRF